jgi:hypothetical protein
MKLYFARDLYVYEYLVLNFQEKNVTCYEDRVGRYVNIKKLLNITLHLNY